jgi:hypothetical protein
VDRIADQANDGREILMIKKLVSPEFWARE